LMTELNFKGDETKKVTKLEKITKLYKIQVP